ncbi:unnamed protein product [Penicillium bialowiezense]
MSSSVTGQTSVLTMCQDNVADCVQNYQGGTNTMTKWAKQVWTQTDDGGYLDFFQGKTMSTALMHELTHAPAIVGADYLIDQPCVNPDSTTGKAYGWYCITQLATNIPNLAIKNAGMKLLKESKVRE